MWSWFKRRVRTLSSLDAYELWAEHYPATPHNTLMALEQEAMLSLLPALAGKVVLDLGCGTGRYSLIAKAHGAKVVIGLDNSEAMLRRAEHDRVGLATMGAIPLATASVDVILCGLAIGHLRDLTPSLQEMGRILKPNGYALISDFAREAFQKGAQRTFTAPDGTVYAVEHYPHALQDDTPTLHKAGLRLEHVQPVAYEKRVIVEVYRLLCVTGTDVKHQKP